MASEKEMQTRVSHWLRDRERAGTTRHVVAETSIKRVTDKA